MSNARFTSILFSWAMIIVFSLTCACERTPILVGFSGSLSGIYSDLGVQGRNGALLAIEEINAQGGVAHRRLKLISKDGGDTPKQARQADRELIKKGVVAIIGHMTSSQSIAALPLLEKYGVVMLSPTTSTPRLSGKKDMFFRVQASTDQAALVLGRFARSRFDLERVSTIRDMDNQAYSDPFNKNFIQGFREDKANKAEILQQCQYSSPRMQKWSKMIACLKQGDPQGILIIASARDTAALIQSMQKHSLQCLLFSSGWAATRSLLTQGGGAVNDLYIARAGVPVKQNKAYQRFVERYKKRFGRAPSFAAEQGYHAAKVLALGLKKTFGRREGLSRALTRIEDFESFYGPLSLNEYGDAITSVTILRVSQGTFVPVEKMKAGAK